MKFLTKKISEICVIYDKLRKPISKKDRKAGIYPYYGASCIQDYVDDYLFDGRYILIGEDGAKWNSGEETAYIAEGKFWVNNHAHIIKVNEDIVDTYVKYYFTHLDLTEFVAGAIIPKLTQETLKNIKIPIPSLSEQQRIVDILDAEFAKIDALKENAEKNLQNAKDLYQAVLRKELEPKDGWIISTLKELLILKSGDNLTAKSIVEGSYPVYGGNGILGYHNEYNLDGHNVLVGRVGALCGNVRLTEGKLWYTDNCFLVCDKTGSFYLPYLSYVLQNANLRQYATQAAQPVVSNTSMKDVLLTLPPMMEEQQRIADGLNILKNNCEQLQINYEKTITLCNGLKQALLRKAFNGEL